MATWQEILKHFNGSLIAGRVIVRVNKKHVEVGYMNNGLFAWTPAGLELSKTVVIPRAVPATSPIPTRRAARKPKDAPNAGSED